MISNDDGIQAEGIARLARAAAQFGDVWVAAPQSQCSGMSQKLTIFGEIAVERAVFPAPVQEAWAIGGTPVLIFGQNTWYQPGSADSPATKNPLRGTTTQPG